MKEIKKLQLIFLLLIVLALIVTACGGQTPAAPTNSPTSPTTITTTAPAVATATPPATLQASSTAVPPTIPATLDAGPLVAQPLLVPDALRTGVFAEDRTLNLPQGFGISVFDAGLTQPRMIVAGPDGRLWVTELGAGRVLVYEPQGTAGTPTEPRVFAEGLNRPHGIALHDDYVYIAETTRVLRIRNENGQALGSRR